MKTTYHIKSAKKVPNFAARWRAICKYFITSDKTQPRRTEKMIKMQGEIIQLYSSNKPQD